MKRKLYAVMLAVGVITSFSAWAESGYELAVEYEAEKEKHGGWSDELFLIPGFEVKNPVINKVEFLLGYTQPRESGDVGSSTSLGIRVRKDVELNERFSAFARVAALHTYVSTGASDYNYGYIEPGLSMALTHGMGFTVSDRIQNAIDGTSNKRVNMLRVGPDFEIGHHQDLELRYISTTGDYDADSVMAEYSFKF